MLQARPLFVSDVYFPRVNGVSTSIRSFRQDLSRLGIESTLVAPQYLAAPDAGANSGAHALANKSESVLRVAARPVPRDPEDRIMRWDELRRCLDGIAPASYNLVHIQTPFLAHYAGVALARRRQVPVIATCHTYFEDYLHHYLPLLPRFASSWLARAVMTSQLNAVDAVVSPSEQVRQRLLEYGVKRPIHVIPTGMTEERFTPGDGQRFRQQQGIAPQQPILLNVGRVAFEKNLSFLLRMFVEVRKRRPDALLVIAGEGPARNALIAEATSLGLGESVRFIGNLDRDSQLNDCYAAADIFVFASRTETQGLVLLEAMAQGRVVVSTACLGTRSVLTSESGANVVDEHESDFATAVVATLRQPASARDRGEKGRRWAMRWSSRSMAQRMSELYHEVQIAHGGGLQAICPEVP
ncbi:MAG: glycosyltransferase [Pseudomonadota bacterium]